MNTPHILVIAPYTFGIFITTPLRTEHYTLSLAATVPEGIEQIKHTRPEIIIFHEIYVHLEANWLEREWSTTDLFYELEQLGCADIPLIAICGYDHYSRLHPTLVRFSDLIAFNMLEYVYQRVPSPMVGLWYGNYQYFREPSRCIPRLLFVAHSDMLPFYHDAVHDEPWEIITSTSLEDAKNAIVIHRPDAIVLDDEGLQGRSLDVYWRLRQGLRDGALFILISSDYKPQADFNVRSLDLLRCEPQQRDAAIHALKHLVASMHAPPVSTANPPRWILVLAEHRIAIWIARLLISQGYHTIVCTRIEAAMAALNQQPCDRD